MTLKQIFNRLTAETGITQAEIAKQLGVDNAIVTRIKQRDDRNSIHIPKIAAIFGLSTQQFLGNEMEFPKTNKLPRSDLTTELDLMVLTGKLTLKQQNQILAFARVLADS